LNWFFGKSCAQTPDAAAQAKANPSKARCNMVDSPRAADRSWSEASAVPSLSPSPQAWQCCARGKVHEPAMPKERLPVHLDEQDSL